MLLVTLLFWEWFLILQFFMASIVMIDIIRHRMELKTKLLWSFIVLFGSVMGIFLYMKIGRTGRYR